jgi:hypothetical protein
MQLLTVWIDVYGNPRRSVFHHVRPRAMNAELLMHVVVLQLLTKTLGIYETQYLDLRL